VGDFLPGYEASSVYGLYRFSHITE
jgi:hypothetical protein